MWCAPRCLSSLQSLQSWRSQASFSLRGPLILEAPACLPPGSPPPAAAGRRPADIWVPRGMSHFAEAWDFPVSSLLRTSHLKAASATVAGVFYSTRLSLASVPSRAPPSRWPSVGRLSRRLAGRRRRCGPRPFEQSWLGLPPSHALIAVLPLICLVTPASGLPSASAAPFTGKTRAQS